MKRITAQQALELLDDGGHTIYIFNDCYGGGPPRFHDNLEKTLPDVDDASHVVRTIERHGVKGACCDEYAAFGVAIVPVWAEVFMRVHEYDGKETPYFDGNTYRMTRIREVLSNKGVLKQAEFDAICSEAESVVVQKIEFAKY